MVTTRPGQVLAPGQPRQQRCQVRWRHVQWHAHDVQPLLGGGGVEQLRRAHMGDGVGHDADEPGGSVDLHQMPAILMYLTTR